MYALQIDDPEKASNYFQYLHNVETKTLDTAKENALNARYMELEQRISKYAVDDGLYTFNTSSAFALALLLQQEDAGVSILFMKNGEFKQLYASDTTYQEDGQTIEAIIREICR